MSAVAHISGHRYVGAQHSSAHSYLLPWVKQELAPIKTAHAGPEAPRLLDLGCGNGSIDAALVQDGWDVIGVDVSSEGIAQAQRVYLELIAREGIGIRRPCHEVWPLHRCCQPRSSRAYLRSAPLRAHSVQLEETRRRCHRLDTLSRISEEPRADGDRQNGRAFPRAPGPLANQVLVDPDADHSSDRSRFRDAAPRKGRAYAATREVDDRHCSQTYRLSALTSVTSDRHGQMPRYLARAIERPITLLMSLKNAQ